MDEDRQVSVYGTIVEVKKAGGGAGDVAMLICEKAGGAFLGVVVYSEFSGIPDNPPLQRLIGVRGLRGVEYSMWSVREEKP